MTSRLSISHVVFTLVKHVRVPESGNYFSTIYIMTDLIKSGESIKTDERLPSILKQSFYKCY